VAEIEEVEWRPRPEGANFILHLEDKPAFPLRLRRGAGLWNAKLHDLLGQPMLGDRGLPRNEHDGESEEEPHDRETTHDRKAT